MTRLNRLHSINMKTRASRQVFQATGAVYRSQVNVQKSYKGKHLVFSSKNVSFDFNTFSWVVNCDFSLSPAWRWLQLCHYKAKWYVQWSQPLNSKNKESKPGQVKNDIEFLKTFCCIIFPTILNLETNIFNNGNGIMISTMRLVRKIHFYLFRSCIWWVALLTGMFTFLLLLDSLKGSLTADLTWTWARVRLRVLNSLLTM